MKQGQIFLIFFKDFFFLVLLCLLRQIRVVLLGKAQQPQEQRYPFLSLCVVWLPVFGIFNAHSEFDACDFTRGLY